ncbi:CLUMA_CG010588, isoform A [Clunio marinus]|uniref:CLUMA_CG010588, isoform A n=1 Tax=Clunio marinus TaxID=568069 RepID=A0A1J1IA77_9DIPT|nr:CLUMA_CG010588, isoform A [Clunio marinus]
MANIFKKFRFILKDYCLNCSLAGWRYIADSQYHISERIFWLICVIISWIGSFDLILKYMNSFNNSAVSMGVVSLRPNEVLNFPSIGICEYGIQGDNHSTFYNVVNEYHANYEKEVGQSLDYNYDVEAFLFRVVFHNAYTLGSMTTFCEPYKDYDDCVKCPTEGYENFAMKSRKNCSQMFDTCMWNGKKFDCCHYFKPLATSVGKCFLLNSIQTVKKNGPYWLDMKIGMFLGPGNLTLILKRASALYILAEEEIPHILLQTLEMQQIQQGYDGELFLSYQDTVNYETLRDVDPKKRKCLFPEEQSGLTYKYYSFSTCVTECLKKHQIAICNCTHYNMIYDKNDKMSVGGILGLFMGASIISLVELIYFFTIRHFRRQDIPE